MSQQLADLLFPEITTSPADFKKSRPEGQIVTRFAPSPTGSLHIGALYQNVLQEGFTHQRKGVYMLRIEDTDQARLVDNGINIIINGLKDFGIQFDEGPLGPDNADVGAYGPYIQSHRDHIYKTFIKDALVRGIAYPCRLSPDQLDAIRKEQEILKQPTGVYGNYARRRNASPEEVTAQLAQEPNGRVVRFKSPGSPNNRTSFFDEIKGQTQATENYNDVVILKRATETGLRLPTYHFAHMVDDYLMGTTHVIRAEERLPSVPLHLQLFETFGLTAPKYAHTAQILKLDDGKKRKLSKRSDPEADVQFLLQEWYAKGGILEYLMTVIDSGFEEWLKADPTRSYRDFPLELEHLTKSGALIDIEKMRSVANFYLSRVNNQDLYAQAFPRLETNAPALAAAMTKDPLYAQKIIGIERAYDDQGNFLPEIADKDPKRYTLFGDIVPNTIFFYDELFAGLSTDGLVRPETVTKDLRQAFVTDYTTNLDLTVPIEEWFEATKNMAHKYGYARNNQEFKTGEYVGKVGDLLMVMRIKLCKASRTPDMYAVMNLLGRDRVVARLGA